MLRQRLSRSDIWLLIFMVAALAMGLWKAGAVSRSAHFVVNTEPASAAPAPVLPGLETSPDGRFRFDASFVSSAPGQAVHAASMVELTDGNLRAVWFSGSREGASDVAIRTAVMDAASGRWSAETTLFDRDQVQTGLVRYVKKLGNPVIARAADGALMLWMVNVSLGGWAGSAISWVRSTDDGQTWSVPRRLVTSPFLNISTLVKSAPVGMTDGRLALPVYHEFITKHAEVLQLDARGAVIDKVRVRDSQTSLQPVLLANSADRAQLFMRSGTATALMASETTDGGATWSATGPTGWPNPDAAVGGVATSRRQQWLALNPTPNHREMLALLHASLGGTFEGATPWVVEAAASPGARLSPDAYAQLLGRELLARGTRVDHTDAYIASARRQLCGGAQCAQEYSYPFLLETRDGALHLIYTWHRTRIKHVRLDPRQAGGVDVGQPRS